MRSILIGFAAATLFASGGLSVAASAAPAGLSSPAPEYTVTDLGPLPIVADQVAIGLNAKGDVCYWESDGKSVQAVVYAGSPSILTGLPPEYHNSIARAIDVDGDIAGWANTSDNPVDSLSKTRAFFYDGKRAVILPTLGGDYSQAYGLNDHGQVVGVSSLADGARHGFVCEHDKITDLPPLPGQSYSAAFAINASGDAAGVSSASNGTKHAVIWRKGKPIDLGTLQGGRDSCAYAIDADGDASGFSETPDGYHAFLYRDGKITDLGTLGGDPSASMGMNDKGDVVGASALAHYGRHAFLWSKGTMTDVNTLIDAASGWTVTEAFAMNDDGEIACVGKSPKQPGVHVLLLKPASDSN